MPGLLRLLSGRRRFRRGSGRAGKQRRRLDGIKLGPTLIQVWFSLAFDLRLVGPGIVAVLVIEHFDHFHSVTFHHAEWRETHTVEARVVHEIDEHLRGARIRPSRGKRDVSLLVALRHRVILNIGSLPGRGHRWIRTDPKLRDKVRYHAEHAGVVKEMMLDQIIEAVRPQRRPGTGDINREVAARGHELYLELRRRLVL